VTFPSRKELKEIVYGPGDAGAGERISPIIQKTRNASPTKTWSSSESQGFMYNSLSGGHDGSGDTAPTLPPQKSKHKRLLRKKELNEASSSSSDYSRQNPVSPLLFSSDSSYETVDSAGEGPSTRNYAKNTMQKS